MTFQDLLLGILMAVGMILYLIWALAISALLARRLPVRIEPPKLSKELIKKLIDNDRVESCPQNGIKVGPLETANWFNRIIHWFFSLSHQSKEGILLWERFVWNEFRELPHDIRRLPLGYFITDGRLIDYYFGSQFPQFKTMCTQKITTMEEADNISLAAEYLVLTSDCEYTGDLEMHMQLDTIFGRCIDLYVQLNLVKGKFYIVLHGDSMYYGFNPKGFQVKFTGRLVVDGWWENETFVNYLISEWVFPLLYRSKFVLPDIKGKWLKNLPEQPPYPWEEQSAQLYDWVPKDKLES